MINMIFFIKKILSITIKFIINKYLQKIIM